MAEWARDDLELEDEDDAPGRFTEGEWPLIEAAAVVATYDPNTLKPLGGAPDRPGRRAQPAAQ